MNIIKKILGKKQTRDERNGSELQAHYQLEISKAEEARRDWLDKKNDSRSLYYGSGHKPFKVNLFRSDEDTLRPKLLNSHGKCRIMPRNNECDSQVKGLAECLQNVIQEVGRIMGYDDEIRACSFDARLNGLNPVKIWWDSHMDMPRIQNWDIDDFLVSKFTRGDYKSADWVAFRTKVRFDRFKQKMEANKDDKDFNQKCLEYINPSSGATKGVGQYSDRHRYVSIWEIWSIDDGLVWYCEEYKDGVVRNSQDWPMPFDRETGEFSMALLTYLQDSKDFWRFPEFHHRKYIYERINNAVEHIMNQMQRAAVKKHIYNSDALTKEEVMKLASNVEEFIGAKKSDMNNIMHTIDRGGISQAVIEGFGLGKSISDELSNVSVELRGGQGKTKSATEAGIRDEWANSRLDDARLMADKFFLPDLYTKIAQYCLFYMTDIEKIVRLVGERLAQYWPAEPWTPEQTKEIFVIGVEPGTTRQSEKTKGKMDAIQFMQTMTPMYANLGAGEQIISSVNKVVREFYPESYSDFEVTREEMAPRVDQQREDEAAVAEQQAMQEQAAMIQGGQI